MTMKNDTFTTQYIHGSVY